MPAFLLPPGNRFPSRSRQRIETARPVHRCSDEQYQSLEAFLPDWPESSDPGIFFGLTAPGRGRVASGAVIAISAEASPVFASLGVIQRAGTIRFILTGAMTSFCRLLK